MNKTINLLRQTLLWITVLTGFVAARADSVVLTENFSGTSNIFGVTSTELAVGAAAIHNTGLSGFDKVLAVCNTTVQGTISGSNGQPVAIGDGTVTVEWDAFHGYFASNLQSKVSLLNSDGKVLMSYAYNSQKCQVVSAVIGEQDVVGFEAFGLQYANGFGGNGKPYTATGNPHVTVTLTARGGVTLEFFKNGTVVKSLLGSLGSLKKDVAKMKIESTVNNTDRCYAVDNIKVTTGEMAVDPDYVEGIASMTIVGDERMTFGPSTAAAFSNSYSVAITGTDGTTLTENTISDKVTDFKVVWDIAGFKTVNDTEGQYCDSYGAFSVNGVGKVATTFDLRDVPMNFFGKMSATVTYNGTTKVATKYVVAQGNTTIPASQVLPLGGYPSDFSSYPDALVGYQVIKETYGASSDLILGGWCAAGSDSHSGTLTKDADGTKFLRITSAAAKKSHVVTKTIDTPSGQLVFKHQMRFNNAGAVVTLTSGYPFWSSSRYTCPVTLKYDGSNILLNNVALTKNDAPVQFTTGTWYQVVLAADKSSERCYAMIYDTAGNLLAQSAVQAWAETSSPTYYSIGMDNANTGSVDVASYEAFQPTPVASNYVLTADKQTLSIPQGESARLVASIADANGYALIGQASWSVVEEDMRSAVIITPDAVDSHIATVTLAPNAEAGTATIQVSIGGMTKTIELSLTSSAESIKFTKSTTSITIPLDDDETVAADFAAVVIDGEGNNVGTTVTLAAYDKDGVNPFAADGITFNSATGVLSVKASAQPAQLTIRATGKNMAGEQLTKNLKVNIHGLKFDFGQTDDAAVAEGFTAVGTTTAYNATNGYGIKSGTAQAGGTASATNADADYLEGPVEFDFKAQKGEFYSVEITYQGVLTTGYVNSDLAGYELGNHASMTTETYTIPATLDIVDLHIANADATHVARIAKVTVTKQAKRQKRGKRVVHHVGDSTSANNGSWAYRLGKMSGTYPELFALCDFQNNGAGGRNLSTYYTQGRLAAVLRDIYPGDILMFGNNGTNGMGNSFEADMNYYLNAAEALGAQVIINSYTPHGAVSNYASGYNATTNKFDSYRRDSYETIVRKVAAQREGNDPNFLGFVEIGKNADAAFNAYVADYAKNGYANANAAAQAIIACFSDHNHYSNATLACDLMLNGYGDVKGIVSQLIDILDVKPEPEVPTGILSLGVQTDEQSLPDVYDLQGRRLTASILKRGLYIMNGRKVFVRR